MRCLTHARVGKRHVTSLDISYNVALIGVGNSKMTIDPNYPIDELHQECMDARAIIRSDFVAARKRASRWVPKPYEEGGDPDV